jgi:hypothetical protein
VEWRYLGRKSEREEMEYTIKEEVLEGRVRSHPPVVNGYVCVEKRGSLSDAGKMSRKLRREPEKS